MKTEYDVKIPRNQYGKGKNATIFWEFYDSEHKTAKYTFETAEEAKRLYQSARNIIYSKLIKDANATIRKNEVYFEKY